MYKLLQNIVACKNKEKLIFIHFLTFLLSLFILVCRAGYAIPKRQDSTNNKPTTTDQRSNVIVNNSNKKLWLNINTSENIASTHNTCDFQNNSALQVKLHNGEMNADIKAGYLINNSNSGQNFNLILQYNSSNSENFSDLLSFSHGWDWNLSHFFKQYNSATIDGRLFTSRGQCFTLSKYRQQWRPCSHQPATDKIKIFGSIYNHILITYPDGSHEILNRDGFETSMKQANGKSIYFSYSDLGFLNYIHDDSGHKINLHLPGDGNLLIVTSYDSNNKPVSLRFFLSRNKGIYPNRIILSDHSNSSILYDNKGCFIRFRSSDGLTESVEYKYGKACTVYRIKFSKPGCDDKIIY